MLSFGEFKIEVSNLTTSEGGKGSSLEAKILSDGWRHRLWRHLGE